MRQNIAYRIFRALENHEQREQEKKTRAEQRRLAALPTPWLGTKKRKETCKCGTCSECIENAKWERIFDEKFAAKAPPERSLFGCALGRSVK